MSVEFQRRVAAVLLEAVGEAGFALAGSSAIREHGLIDRPTNDVDLFAHSATSTEQFQAALSRGEQVLRDAGYEVRRLQAFDQFARLTVLGTDGTGMDVDLAVNWRTDPPVTMTLGPVLSQRDAVAGKLSAVYSRREARDFLDLDAIRTSGRYSDAELLAMAREDDAGFDAVMFAQQLSRVADVQPSEAAKYGVDADALAAVKDRLMAWAVTLRDTDAPSRTAPTVDPASKEPSRAAEAIGRALDERRRALGHRDPPRHGMPRTNPPGRSL